MSFNNKNNVKELLLDSITSDVNQFIAYWEANHEADPASYPAELSDDEWFTQFYAWLGM